MVFLSVLAGPAVVADPAGWVSHAGHAKLAGESTGPLSMYLVPRLCGLGELRIKFRCSQYPKFDARVPPENRT